MFDVLCFTVLLMADCWDFVIILLAVFTCY